MKKKIIVIGIIISILLIGIVSASLLDFFGKITGSVEVKAPILYTSLQKEFFAGEDYGIFNISSSEESRTSIKAWVESPGAEAVLLDWKFPGFIVPQVDYFYESEWRGYYRVKVENGTASFFARIYKLDEEGNKELIEECSKSREISPEEEWATVSSICNFPLTEFEADERILVNYYTDVKSYPYNLTFIQLRVGDYVTSLEKRTRFEVNPTQ